MMQTKIWIFFFFSLLLWNLFLLYEIEWNPAEISNCNWPAPRTIDMIFWGVVIIMTPVCLVWAYLSSRICFHPPIFWKVFWRAINNVPFFVRVFFDVERSRDRTQCRVSSVHGPGRILDPICIPVEFLLSAFELASKTLSKEQRKNLLLLKCNSNWSWR